MLVKWNISFKKSQYKEQKLSLYCIPLGLWIPRTDWKCLPASILRNLPMKSFKMENKKWIHWVPYNQNCKAEWSIYDEVLTSSLSLCLKHKNAHKKYCNKKNLSHIEEYLQVVLNFTSSDVIVMICYKVI
jgi:hypothetical protein